MDGARTARWIAIGAGYIGAVVGAGFASGREVAHFFVRHGGRGLLGAVLAGALFAWMGAAVVRRLSAAGGGHYGGLLREVCGPYVGALLDRSMSLFLFVTLATVLAGTRSVGPAVGLPGWMVAASMAVALAGLDPRRPVHTRVSVALVPGVVGACVVLGLRALHGGALRSLLAGGVGPVAGPPWYLAATLYVGYNLVMALAGLCAVSPRAGERLGPWAAAAGGAILGMLCAALTLAMSERRAAVEAADLPLLSVIPPGRGMELGYIAGLLAALWTTGTAAMTALAQRVPGRHVSQAVVAAAFWVSMLGLHWLVAVAYPIMGYLGIPLLIALAIDTFRPAAGPSHPRANG